METKETKLKKYKKGIYKCAKSAIIISVKEINKKKC